MRTGAAAGHHGYFHEAVTYSTDREFLDLATAFLLAGRAASEPSVAVLDAGGIDLLRRVLPADSGVEFVDNHDLYNRPAATIHNYRKLLGAHVAAGARQIRILGQVPTTADNWDRWADYESVINVAYDDFPLWSNCAYDTRTTPGPMLAEVARTHPRFARPGDRHEVSPTFLEPRSYLSRQRPARPDPLQSGPPTTTLADPVPAQARAAVRAADPGLAPEDLDDLVVAVSETVTNAFRYGVPPVTLRVWRGADRLVVTVTDAGTGPEDPLAGLLPAGDGSLGGRGLWITYQACDQVTAARDEEGWTIRLTAGISAR
ncbi:anti-sigma factor RsbA family regulatory protein [Actinoplanes sp. NPDC051494]|uniref:anti-sigma factor RsbA family regulatory protein n=1 Tax=Actinoplanes sp. NPDC051494 TaxID=3363907 RepID=UPI0037B87CCA